MGELTYRDGFDAAVSVGMLYRKARSSHIQTVQLLLEAGKQLRAQKEALAHGEWLLWIQAHRAELGFGDDTAQKLMRAALQFANTASNAALSDDEASRLNRLIWRNEPEPSPYPNDGPPVAYVHRISQWADKRNWAEFDELDDDERSALLESINRVQSRFSELAARLQNPLRRVA